MDRAVAKAPLEVHIGEDSFPTLPVGRGVIRTHDFLANKQFLRTREKFLTPV